MKTKIIFLCIFMTLCNVGLSDIVFDINYEPPTYTNGQHVGLGDHGETISDSINGFPSQGLLIYDGGGIAYYAPEPFTSGVHTVSWDFAIPAQKNSSSIIDAVLTGNYGSIFNVNLETAGAGNEIQYGDPLPFPRASIPFNIGQAYSFEVLMNLDSDYYSFWVDGGLLEDSVSIAPDATLEVVGFFQNQTMGLQAGIDNFRWEVVPEPSALLLLIGGGSLLLVWRRKR